MARRLTEQGYVKLDLSKLTVLSEREIWESQQGNSFWEDKEKGKAVAQKQYDNMIAEIKRQMEEK